MGVGGPARWERTEASSQKLASLYPVLPGKGLESVLSLVGPVEDAKRGGGVASATVPARRVPQRGHGVRSAAARSGIDPGADGARQTG